MTEAPDRIISLVHEFYNLDATVEPLPGELDLNYRVRTSDGDFVLKLSRPGTDLKALELQHAVMDHLASKSTVDVARMMPTRSGDGITQITDSAGNKQWMRLLTWIPGRPIATVRPHTDELLKNWGGLCGRLTRSLADFDNEAAHRFIKWDPAQVQWIAQHFGLFDGTQKELIEHFYILYGNRAAPALHSLRKGVNYNDANDYNVLVTGVGETVAVPGVIDFGDVVYTHTVNELAIACAYACMHKNDPLGAATQLVKGFHAEYPLTQDEVSVLFPLIGARLLISVTCSALNLREEPDNTYLQVSDPPAWDVLHKLRSIDPSLAEYYFRSACGWEPVPQHEKWKKWVVSFKADPSMLVGFDLTQANVRWLDLSVGSEALGNYYNILDADKLSNRIAAMMREDAYDSALGRFDEVRPLYTTEAFKTMGNQGPEWRTVHMGLDVFAPAGTPVCAMLEGIVHSLADNNIERDYGPTVILQHQVSDSLTFFTLYGHLSRTSLSGKGPGSQVKRGDIIGWIGEKHENGNWPPHLHVQVILDMLGMQCNYPGVAHFVHRTVWRSLCPDPWLLIAGRDSSPQPPIDPEAILDSREKHLGRNLCISYNHPLAIVRGHAQYLIDHTGRRYLDTVNNVAHVGHEHPRVVRAGQRQMAVLNTNTRYLHPRITEFSKELLRTFPAPLDVAFIVNSRSEANELAIRLARTYTGQKDMIVVQVGYHGNTNACVEISSYKFDGKGGQGAPDHVQVVPIPDAYRGLYRGSDAGIHFASHIPRSIDNILAKDRGVAAFICESVLSCGGQVVLPEGYLQEAYAAVRNAGGLCIADEVQTGCGRAGDYFWAFEAQGVIPDIVTVGKPIGNGHPLGAVVTTRAIADAFANGMEYFNTFGGNPVSCSIGLEVLRVIRDEDLQQNARKVANYLTSGLLDLMERHAIIGDVRGVGLFLGFELVKDRTNLEPATREAAHLVNRMRELGILMSSDGPYNNVIKIKPPMVIQNFDIDFLIETLDKVLQEDALKV